MNELKAEVYIAAKTTDNDLKELCTSGNEPTLLLKLKNNNATSPSQVVYKVGVDAVRGVGRFTIDEIVSPDLYRRHAMFEFPLLDTSSNDYIYSPKVVTYTAEEISDENLTMPLYQDEIVYIEPNQSIALYWLTNRQDKGSHPDLCFMIRSSTSSKTSVDKYVESKIYSITDFRKGLLKMTYDIDFEEVANNSYMLPNAMEDDGIDDYQHISDEAIVRLINLNTLDLMKLLVSSIRTEIINELTNKHYVLGMYDIDSEIYARYLIAYKQKIRERMNRLVVCRNIAFANWRAANGVSNVKSAKTLGDAVVKFSDYLKAIHVPYELHCTCWRCRSGSIRLDLLPAIEEVCYDTNSDSYKVLGKN